MNRSSTPPLGALKLTVPLALKKNGNRASRVGPLAVMKYGVVSAGRDPVAGELELGIDGSTGPADRRLRVARTALI